MKKIPLSQGKFALVDDEDYEWLMQWKWCAHKLDNVYYAHRKDRDTGKTTSMHRQLLGLTDPKIIGDHKDGDGLNNQRNNLRPCTSSQNAINRRITNLGKSKFKGVSWDKHYEMWRVRIGIEGKRIHIGRFLDEIDAAVAYNIAAKHIHNEFAVFNKIP